MTQHITARGSVTKRKRRRRDGTEYIVFRAQVPDPALPPAAKKNIEKVFAVPAYGSIKAAREAAEDWKAEQLKAMRAGKWKAAQAVPTVAEVAESWRGTWALKRLKPRTQLGYTNILNRRVLPHWGAMRVDAVTAYAVQQWVNELAAGRDVSTTKNAYNVLRNVLRHAARQGHIDANPCTADTIELPSKRRRRSAAGGTAAGVALTTAELVRLVDALPEHWRTPVMLAAMTGMRAAEVWGITRADWDATTGAFMIRQTLADVGGELIVSAPKTEASERVVFAPEPLPAMLTRLATEPGVRLRGIKAGQAKGYPAVVADDEGEPTLGYVDDADDPRRLLFTMPGGHPVSHGNFYHRYFIPAARQALPELTAAAEARARKRAIKRGADPEKAAKQASPLRFHDLRHSVATQRLDAGDSPTDVMKLLGHSQLATTTDLYGRHRQLAQAKATAERTAAAWASVQAAEPRLRVVEG